MQWLSLVSEDAGVQRLKADNRKPVIARSVDAVSPYPSTHAARIGEGQQLRERVAGRDRRGTTGERRQKERRQKQVPVLLDTRCSNRRDIENRRSDASLPDADELAVAHISIYA